MTLQDLIVYLIIACAVAFIIRYIYRQITGKNRGCNCGCNGSSCPMQGEAHTSSCNHCPYCDTQK